MKIAVFTNVRATHQCWLSLASGYAVSIQGGSVMGLSLVSLGLLNLFCLIKIFIAAGTFEGEPKELYEAIAGYGLGGSSIALFARVGGGIYTKAADVGADLAGKNEWGLDEDDPRNPACIADNVGDNVGDVAGMGADLFGSFAESTCAAMVIAGASGSVLVNGKPNKMGIDQDFGAMCFPLLLSCAGIITGILTLLLCRVIYKINDDPDSSIERGLKGILIVSTILQSFATFGVAFYVLPSEFQIDEDHLVTPMTCCYCILAGLWSGLVIGVVTEYYT